MSASSEPESPFKRDEPVSRSRKWMVLAGIGLAINLVIQGEGFARRGQYALMEVGQAAVTLGCQGFLLFYLWRALRTAGHCRTHRSFDMMAAAVRLQRSFWIMFTVLAGLMAILTVVAGMQLQDRRRFIQDWIQENRPPAAAQPSP